MQIDERTEIHIYRDQNSSVIDSVPQQCPVSGIGTEFTCFLNIVPFFAEPARHSTSRTPVDKESQDGSMDMAARVSPAMTA